MRFKGSLNADWIIAIGIFLVVVAWSFTYYLNFFSYTAEPMDDIVNGITGNVLDFLLADVYTVPVMFNSSNDTNGSIQHFGFSWPFGKNSTRVMGNSQKLPCMITGNSIYWEANVSKGKNMFRMRFTDKDVPMNCTDSLPTANSSQSFPWVQEKDRMILQDNIDNMTGTDYGDFRNIIGVNRDFRVEINSTGGATSYGPLAPRFSDVFVRERWYRIEETSEDVHVRILVW